MMLKRCNKLYHSSSVNLPFVRMSASWFLDSTYVDLDLMDPNWFCQITSPGQLCGSSTRVSSSDFCLWRSPLSQLRCLRKMHKLWFFLREMRDRKNLIFILMDSHSDPWVCFRFLHRLPACTLGLVLVICDSFPKYFNDQILTSRVQNKPPCGRKPDIQRHYLWFCTSNWLEQMFDFQQCTTLRLMLILSPQDLLQCLNLEIILIDKVEPHFSHDNIGGNHLCHECKRLIVPIVCHMLESIMWQIVRFYWLTTECQVDQFVPKMSILKQYGSKLQTMHLYFPVLPFWFGDRPNKDWKPWKVAPFSCLPIRNNVLRIFEHVLPCRRTTLKFLSVVCPIPVICRLLQQKYGTQTSCCIVQWFSRLVCISVECIPFKSKQTWSRNDVGSSISTFFINFFHMGAKFCFLPAILMSSTLTDKNNFCFLWTNKHSQFGTFSQPISINASQIVFPTRGTTRSSMYSHDFGQLCFRTRVHTSGHSDMGNK